MTVLDKLAGIIRETFDAPDAEIAARTTANEVDGWDSLSHVNLMAAVEVHFGVTFTTQEIMSFRNVGDLAACVERKLHR